MTNPLVLCLVTAIQVFGALVAKAHSNSNLFAMGRSVSLHLVNLAIFMRSLGKECNACELLSMAVSIYFPLLSMPMRMIRLTLVKAALKELTSWALFNADKQNTSIIYLSLSNTCAY